MEVLVLSSTHPDIFDAHSLTTAFVAYATALTSVATAPNGAAVLEAAKAQLFATVNQDVLYLVYIG